MLVCVNETGETIGELDLPYSPMHSYLILQEEAVVDLATYSGISPYAHLQRTQVNIPLVDRKLSRVVSRFEMARMGEQEMINNVMRDFQRSIPEGAKSDLSRHQCMMSGDITFTARYVVGEINCVISEAVFDHPQFTPY